MINKAKNIAEIQAAMNSSKDRTLMDALGIEITELTEERIRGTMPVDERTVQYYRMLHGGASVAFAETLASVAAGVHVDLTTERPVGLEINANHIRGMSTGKVLGEARPIHLGKKTQIWNIEIKDEQGRMVCVSRCTMAVISNKS